MLEFRFEFNLRRHLWSVNQTIWKLFFGWFIQHVCGFFPLYRNEYTSCIIWSICLLTVSGYWPMKSRVSKLVCETNALLFFNDSSCFPTFSDEQWQAELRKIFTIYNLQFFTIVDKYDAFAHKPKLKTVDNIEIDEYFRRFYVNNVQSTVILRFSVFQNNERAIVIPLYVFEHYYLC